MKLVIASLLLAFSFPALATQIITCREINKSGSVKKNGGTLKATLQINANGSLKAKGNVVNTGGFTRDPADKGYDNMSVRSVNQSKPGADIKYTTFFLAPEFDDGMLDIQLQFRSPVLGQEFKAEPGEFVIGSDDANPETSFAFGFSLTCDATVH